MRCAYTSTTCPADDDVPWHSGGDIAAVVRTPALVRVLIGDVMGHGPRAGETAALLRGVFARLAAHEQDPPQVIAARLDRLVADRADQQERDHREEFVTAQLIDVPRGCDRRAEPRIVCCGHPPPLLLRDGTATFLDAIPPAPPLGLLDLTDESCPLSCPLGARAGDTVLLYTDGVTEARSAAGAVYPFAERAALVSAELAREFGGERESGTGREFDEGHMGAALVDALRTGLAAHIGGRFRDDATLAALHLADEPCEGERAGAGNARSEQVNGYSKVQYS